jgi:hypothetical protein
MVRRMPEAVICWSPYLIPSSISEGTKGKEINPKKEIINAKGEQKANEEQDLKKTI